MQTASCFTRYDGLCGGDRPAPARFPNSRRKTELNRLWRIFSFGNRCQPHLLLALAQIHLLQFSRRDKSFSRITAAAKVEGDNIRLVGPAVFLELDYRKNRILPIMQQSLASNPCLHKQRVIYGAFTHELSFSFEFYQQPEAVLMPPRIYSRKAKMNNLQSWLLSDLSQRDSPNI